MLACVRWTLELFKKGPMKVDCRKNYKAVLSRKWLKRQTLPRLIWGGLMSSLRALSFVVEFLFSYGPRKEFRQKLVGQSVAIVGPAPMSLDYENEISSSDFVIRVGLEHWPWEGTGSKVDAWTCDGGLTKELLRGGAEMPDAAWILLKHGSFYSRNSMFGFVRALRLKRRAFKNGSKIFFASVPTDREFKKKFGAGALGTPLDRVNLNQVPMALFEVCRHNPRSTMIFGSDYYLGEVFYARGSPEKLISEASKEFFLDRMFKSHDQIVQRQICKALLFSGDWMVGGSDEFLRLTRMNEIEFKLKLANASAS